MTFNGRSSQDGLTTTRMVYNKHNLRRNHFVVICNPCSVYLRYFFTGDKSLRVLKLT